MEENWEKVGIPCAWTGDGEFFGRGVGFCGGIGVGETCHGVLEGFVVSA